MNTNGRERWPGGYIHRQQNGQPLFVLEREVGGRRFHRSTRCHTLKAAMKQLERFEADPANYRPDGDSEEGDAPLFLTAELADAFWRWQIETKGVTRKHANEVSSRLVHWIEDLGRVDLRKATLRDHIKPALDARKTMRSHRISTLKSFYAWLREEKHLLTHHQDPTLDLPVPQSKPEKRKRKKAVELERVLAVLEYLEGPYRDLMVLFGATGWHVTEVERFIRNPESEILHAKREGTIAVLVTRHKNREWTRTPVTDLDVLAAAERLRGRGKMPRRPNSALQEACDKAKVARFTFGVMRHTVGTWGVEEGASPERVSEFLAHKDKRTTENFYIDVGVPTNSVPLPKLRVVKG
jgi:integrase